MAAPTLIVLGDADGIRLEHAVELFRLRGGGAMGDITGLPAAQLAVLPGTTHFIRPARASRSRASGRSRSSSASSTRLRRRADRTARA